MDEVFSLGAMEAKDQSTPSRGNSSSQPSSLAIDSSMNKTAGFKSFKQINVVNTPNDSSMNSEIKRPIRVKKSPYLVQSIASSRQETIRDLFFSSPNVRKPTISEKSEFQS